MMKTVCKMCGEAYNDKLNLSPWCKKCNEEMDSWADPKSQSQSESSIQEKSKNVSGEKIQSGELKNKLSGESDTPKTLNATKRKAEPDTQKTRSETMPDEQNGAKKTESDSLQVNEVTTQQTRKDLEKLSMLPVERETQSLEVYTPSLIDLKKEVSQSINLLNQSEAELFESMKGLRSSQPDTAIKLYDPERVQTAVLCGRSIVDSMKTKLEILKFAKELK